MRRFTKQALLAALFAGVAGQALAADLLEPPVVEPPPAVDYAPAPAFGGWYIRGDVDYHWTDWRDGDYVLYGERGGRGHFKEGDLDESWSLGAGVGYQINDYLRTDLTVDYFADADFRGKTEGCDVDALGNTDCHTIVSSTDRSSMDAWLVLANAYAELGTYYGFTPYVGAGIGGAYVKWDDLKNTTHYSGGDDTTTHHGEDDWRFAWALMAGTSYCLTSNLEADVGYRFARIEDGGMFGYANGGGPGYDDGFNVHEIKAGLRYNFGGPRPACAPPEPIAYEPPPVEPVYK